MIVLKQEGGNRLNCPAQEWHTLKRMGEVQDAEFRDAHDGVQDNVTSWDMRHSSPDTTPAPEGMAWVDTQEECDPSQRGSTVEGVTIV